MPEDLDQLNDRVTHCRACPRLVQRREQVGREKRAAYRGEDYWAKPVPGFGDRTAEIVLIGLAPGAHGANRTGRMFTGDRSGDFLYPSLYRCGLSSQPSSSRRSDGLVLKNAYITAAVRCVPPQNRPTTEERDNCLPYLEREVALLTRATVFVCLGQFAWDAALRTLPAQPPRPKPKFAHGAEWQTEGSRLLGCYHPSQQNTFTGKLTEPMLDAIFTRAKQLTEK